MNASAPAPRLPAQILAAIGERTGRDARIEPLAGLSGRTVARVRGPRGSVVVKGPASAPEVAVARRLSGWLGRHGVRTPEVFAVIDTAQAGSWIVMEHLPRPLPRERWGDDDVVATLRTLHGLAPDLVEPLPGRYRPRWDEAMTTRAATTLAGDDAFVSQLRVLATRAQPLFEPRCVVSGDPNPLNWRIDDAGRPVLLDLERITVADPALDLAILLPGLPDRAATSAVISSYGAGAPTVDDVLLAKAWSVVELAATKADARPVRDVLAQLVPAFGDWVAEL